jgi:chromosome segregation protein
MSDTHLMQEKAEAYRLEYQAARETQERLREELTQKLLEYSKAEHETAVLLKDRERLAEETRMLEDRIFRTEQAVETLQTEARQALAERVTGEELTSAAAVKMRSSEEMVEKTEAARRGRQEELSAIHRSIEELHLSGAADYDRRHQADIAKTRLEGELGALRDRIWNTYELTYAGAESFRCEGKFELSAGDKRAQELRVAIRGMGTVNVSAIQDYADTKARYDEMTAQRDDLTHARTDLEKLIRQLETQMEKQFISQFTLIQGYFQETFARLFGGGNAELKLQDPNDALNCGIEVIAQPPGKKLQLLSLLSGGEKALCAIAILFAMLKLKATPFCLLDEIEAALDEANLGYFSDYLAEYGQSTQFVVVTHRKPTMEHCDSLFGVAMEEQGVSRMVSVNLTDNPA